MDPVTSYECRHKLKTGEVCSSGVSALDWLQVTSPQSAILLLRYQRMYPQNQHMREMIDEMAVRWATREGWYPGVSRPIPRYPHHLEIRRTTWWERHRSTITDAVWFALVFFVLAVVVFLIAQVVMWVGR
jgi:hypothetical protein